MKVLVATDGSRYAARAAELLGSRLRRDGRVEIDLAAVPEPADGGNGADPRAWSNVSAWVDRTSAILREHGLSPGALVLDGEPGPSLVQAASGYDLVVAGVKGRGAAPFFELGRVALALVRGSASSVLLVRDRRPRRRASTEQDGAEPFRVLLPTDGTEAGLAAAWELLGPFSVPDVEVEVATVMEPRPEVTAASPKPWSGGASTDVRSRARRWLQRAVSDLPSASAAARPVVLEGRPAPEIARRAQQAKTDLIILGCGRNGRTDGSPGLGSTARELAWSAPCSVLLVRDPRIPGGADAHERG